MEDSEAAGSGNFSPYGGKTIEESEESRTYTGKASEREVQGHIVLKKAPLPGPNPGHRREHYHYATTTLNLMSTFIFLNTLDMDFGHLAFYTRALTLEDILREPQRVPERSLYKFAYGGEIRLEQALTLIDKLALEELHEVMRFTRMRRNMISAERDGNGFMEGLWDEMAQSQAAADAAPDAGAGGGVAAPDVVASANAPGGAGAL